MSSIDEDYIGGYFSERGPRETTALLDIERALNKLEKVALKHRAKKSKPLIVIVNQCHLIRDDEDGKDLLELLQQRAEQWAAANLVTMVFNTDDYWVYERFKQLATRMEVLSVHDLPKSQAVAALKKYRNRYFKEDVPNDKLEAVYDLVGGRLSFLNRVAKSMDMIKTCNQIKEIEKTWFLNQCWILGSEMDDDVMDQQKWAVSWFHSFPLYLIADVRFFPGPKQRFWPSVFGSHQEARLCCTRPAWLSLKNFLCSKLADMTTGCSHGTCAGAGRQRRRDG